MGCSTPANTNDTCFLLHATFFVGAPVKNTHGQPALSRQEGPQERGFGLLVLSSVRNKVKALSLLEKHTVCVWAFILRIWRWSGYQGIPEEPTWVSRQRLRVHRVWHPPTPAPWPPTSIEPFRAPVCRCGPKVRETHGHQCQEAGTLPTAHPTYMPKFTSLPPQCQEVGTLPPLTLSTHPNLHLYHPDLALRRRGHPTGG